MILPGRENKGGAATSEADRRDGLVAHKQGVSATLTGMALQTLWRTPAHRNLPTRFAMSTASPTSARSPRPVISPSSLAPLSSSFLSTLTSSPPSKCKWVRRPSAPTTAFLSASQAPMG